MSGVVLDGAIRWLVGMATGSVARRLIAVPLIVVLLVLLMPLRWILSRRLGAELRRDYVLNRREARRAVLGCRSYRLSRDDAVRWAKWSA